MPSVFDYCKQHFFRQEPPETRVSNSHIDTTTAYALKTRSRYFEITDSITDGTTLAIRPVQLFDANNPDHKELLTQMTQSFKAKSNALMQRDKDIMAGLAFGVIGTSLSFLPILGWVGLAGYFYAASQAYHREKAYTEYHAALTELVGACNWSLGALNNNQAEELTQTPEIRTMMMALYRVLTEQNIRDLIDNEIETLFVDELETYNSSVPVPGYEDNIRASKKGADFIRCIYGYNKGQLVDFVDALVSLIPDAYHMACDGLERVQDWWQSTAPSPALEHSI